MYGTLISCLVLLQLPPDTRPVLGIAVELHAEPITVDDRTFPHGLRIEAVLSASAAAAAGLRVGDVIVEIDGFDFAAPSAELVNVFQDGLAARESGDRVRITAFRSGVERSARLNDVPIDEADVWTHPETFVLHRPLGAELQLTARHTGRLLSVTATLRTRQDVVAGPHKLPTNEEIARVPLLPEAALAADLIAHAGAEAEYERLRKRLARLVDTGDVFRLARVAYALREPFALPGLAEELRNLPLELPGALTVAAKWIDRDLSLHAPVPLKTGLTLDEHVEQIEHLLGSVALLHELAFAELTTEEIEFLVAALPDLDASFREVVMVLSDPNPRRQERVRRCIDILARVNPAPLIEAACRLAVLTDPNYLTGLAEDLRELPDGDVHKKPGPMGDIIIAGRGRHWHRDRAAVLIDLGGDDWYTQPNNPAVNVVIDLDGNDTHQATFDGAQGAAQLGVALLLDCAGNDLYIAQRWGQGAAAVGVGVLWDQAGDDEYRGLDYCQGAALVGIGLLIDAAGNDRYEAPRHAQGLGMPGGFGALLDRAGDDRYYCAGRDPTNYGTQGVFDAMGQGCGIGFRGLASGGVGLLRDDSGNDVYYGANFAQGGGYYFGLGAQLEGGGDDRYRGARYAQAWAAHQAVGFLEDAAGNDVYECWQGVGQSCAWDESVTVLLDRAGDDRYTGPFGFSRCAAHNNGWALLIDYAGRDVYEAFPGVPRADGDEQVSSFALLLDYGGAEDAYGAEGLNDSVRQGNRHGTFADFSGDLDDARANWRSLFPVKGDR